MNEIERQEAVINELKAIFARYRDKNPRKAAIKQEEFAKKLALEEEKLQMLRDRGSQFILAQQADQERIRQTELEEIARREAELEQARQEGYEKALKEQSKKKVDDKTK